MDEKLMSVRGDLLIVEDLVLFLTDDDGASTQARGTLYYTLGGAVLTELALLVRIHADDSAGMNGPGSTPSAPRALEDRRLGGLDLSRLGFGAMGIRCEPRYVPLGGPRAMNVRRTLPQRQRSLIGAWCFVDHYGRTTWRPLAGWTWRRIRTPGCRRSVGCSKGPSPTSTTAATARTSSPER
jgi:hypothetical protein